MYIIPATQTTPTASDLGTSVETRPAGEFAQVLKNLLIDEKLTEPTPDVKKLLQEQEDSDGGNTDEKEMLPDLSNEEVFLSDVATETELLSVNLQYKSPNAVVHKRASSMDMTILLRDSGNELPTRIAGLPSEDSVPAPQATAGNSIFEMKKRPAKPIWTAVRQFIQPSAHAIVEGGGPTVPNADKSSQVLPVVAWRGSGMLFDPAKKIEPLLATAQIPLPEGERAVPSARVGPDQSFNPIMNASALSLVPADMPVRSDQKPHAAMEATRLGPRSADTSAPSVRDDQRNLPSLNGANAPSVPSNPVVPIDASKLMVVDNGSVESAFFLSSLDTSKAGPLITTHPADVRNPSQTFTPATAQQLAVAVHKTQDGVTSLVLNPEELGRVRLAITTQDGIMAVTITTERAETQDLMRRHIDMLAQEMRELGYENVGFSFEGRGGGDHESQTTPERIIEQELLLVDAPLAATATQSGLDLRL